MKNKMNEKSESGGIVACQECSDFRRSIRSTVFGEAINPLS
jgi:hypothetical protein